MVPELSSESATGKAIVLVPAALDAGKPIEVAVFLHGHTEDRGRPYAGYRTLVDPAPSTKGQKPWLAEQLKRFRQGVDAQDTAPVRDVALDQAAQQLEESGRTQLVFVLPQGGLHSQFSKDGKKDFEAGPYVKEILARLKAEKRWTDGKGTVLDVIPTVSRITMAGHSGAGAALSKMADRKGALTGDLVLYDAINGDEIDAFKRWVTKRLNEDLAVLADPAKSDADKLAYLRDAQKLRGYTTNSYISAYIALDDHIAEWFRNNKRKLGPWAACLRANYTLDFVGVSHEELMRGSRAGQPRPAGTGTILDAIKGLHPPAYGSPGACPPIPKSLRQRRYGP